MPIGLGIYGGHLPNGRCEADKSGKSKKQTEQEKLVNAVVEKMKGKLEEEAKKLAAKSPASRFRYDEQPEYSHAPYPWSPSASQYSAASPHVPPPPYTHISAFNNSSYQPGMSRSIPYHSFSNRPPSPYHSYYAPTSTARYPSDLKHEASFYTPSYSKRHGASAPQIVISSRPYLHSRYPSGHEYLRTDVGFYPYNPDPNVNGLAWLSKKGFETQQDITVNFEDYDGFIRSHCPDARLLVPYQDLP
ncbi:hypothetical protein NXS19_014169 [Fusarium pseudograminearum]|nr:hypothetical protein NXS19_014169 [Fusarium pseudograminearum]